MVSGEYESEVRCVSMGVSWILDLLLFCGDVVIVQCLLNLL